MDKSQLLKQYYAYTLKSADLAGQIAGLLDQIRLGSLSLNHESVVESNERIEELTQKLQSLHFKRQDIADNLGCRHDRFAIELVNKLSGKNKQMIFQATKELKEQLKLCREKSDLQAQLMQQQQVILTDALQALRFEVNA
ncbi:MAG: hypothetical protein ACK5NC_05960 [Vibrio sp.]